MAVDKLADSSARDYELGAMAQAIRLCLLDTAQFSQAEVELLGIPWLDRYGFAQALMQGIKPYIGGGGIKVVSGTKTLTEAASSVSIETGETTTGKLLLAVLSGRTPVYGVAGSNGAVRLKWPGPAVLNSAPITAVIESREGWDDNSQPLVISASSAVFTDAEVRFIPRTTAYKFFTGVYDWFAVYGEVYGS